MWYEEKWGKKCGTTNQKEDDQLEDENPDYERWRGVDYGIGESKWPIRLEGWLSRPH